MPRLSILFVLTASFVILDLTAASTFKPNCTLPPAHTNFVSGPNTRSTLTILWNCLSIILLCTWNIQHLNIPAARPYLDKTVKYRWVKKTWRAILDSRTNLKWMLLTILMPEYIMGKALNELIAAWYAYQRLQLWERRDKVPYEMIHGYFANMGGYYLDFTGVTDAPHNLSESPNPTDKSTKANSTHPRVLEAGDSEKNYFEGLAKEAESDPRTGRNEEINLSRLKHNPWVLNFNQLGEARRRRLFKSLPDVPARHLEILSNSDALVKILAIIQVSWLMIQLLVRKINSIPSSQLEIAALAFSVSSLITYALLWYRPQRIEIRYEIKATRPPNSSDLQFLSWVGPRYLWTWRRDLSSESKLTPIPNDASHPVGNPNEGGLSGWMYENNGEALTVLVGSVLGGIVFGGIHCLAWNFPFPTPTEVLLWRICSIYTTTIISAF
jgi:hypothetical protein